MKCPKCETSLVRSRYAGANVRECESCSGMLLCRNRATKIERRVNKDIQQLVEETETVASSDTLEKVRCPACRNRMDKSLIEKIGIHIDECRNCDNAWFDGGELALLQLAYENRDQTVELNQMRDRLKNMSAAERAEYEERIANLVDLGSPMEQAIRGATLELSERYWWYGLR